SHGAGVHRGKCAVERCGAIAFSAWVILRSGHIGGCNAQERPHFLAGRGAALADAFVIFAEDFSGALHLLRLAFDFEVVLFQLRGDAQGGFEELEIFIEGAEKFADPPAIRTVCLIKWAAATPLAVSGLAAERVPQ